MRICDHPHITRAERLGVVDMTLKCAVCTVKRDDCAFCGGVPLCPSCFFERRSELKEGIKVLCLTLGVEVNLEKAKKAARLLMEEDF